MYVTVPIHYTLLSWRLKSHQSIIVVLFQIDKRDVGGAGDPQAYTLRQTFSPPGKQPLLSHLRKPNTQVFLNDFKMILPFLFYVYFFYFLFFLLFVVYTILLFYLFSRWLFFFFFTLTLFCLPLFRRLHSSGKHLLRVYPADANNSNHLAPCSPPIWSSTIETFKHNEITDVALCINWLGTEMREKEVLADVHTTRWSRGS